VARSSISPISSFEPCASSCTGEEATGAVEAVVGTAVVDAVVVGTVVELSAATGLVASAVVADTVGAVCSAFCSTGAAVATEAFFGRPDDVRQEYPELFEALREFYERDPDGI
jgi:hypothetical protein